MWLKVGVTIIVAILFCGCDPRFGMKENELRLSPESRLPRWFQAPPDYTRKDLTMTITTYIATSGLQSRMVIRGPAPAYKVLSDKIGPKKIHPLTEQQGYDKYPLYAIITVDGVEEVFEQRRPEAIFYISDDPKYTSVLKQQKAPK